MMYLDGVQRLLGQLYAKRDAAIGGYARGGLKAARVMLKEADYYVPTDTKELRKSGTVRVIGHGRDTVFVVEYTDEKATIVHEDLDAAHGDRFNQKHAADIRAGRTHRRRPQERAKWLEHASRSSRPQQKRALRDEIRKALARS